MAWIAFLLIASAWGDIRVHYNDGTVRNIFLSEKEDKVYYRECSLKNRENGLGRDCISQKGNEFSRTRTEYSKQMRRLHHAPEDFLDDDAINRVTLQIEIRNREKDRGISEGNLPSIKEGLLQAEEGFLKKLRSTEELNLIKGEDDEAIDDVFHAFQELWVDGRRMVWRYASDPITYPEAERLCSGEWKLPSFIDWCWDAQCGNPLDKGTPREEIAKSTLGRQRSSDNAWATGRYFVFLGQRANYPTNGFGSHWKNAYPLQTAPLYCIKKVKGPDSESRFD